jgi:hypothetical protein
MKILSLSYYSDILNHSMPEFFFHKNNSCYGKYNITYLVCDKFFNSINCKSMDNRGIKSNESKNKVCHNCVKTSDFYQKNSNFNFLKISDFVYYEDQKQAQIFLNKITPKNIFKRKFMGINIGEILKFDYILSNKLTYLEINSENFIKLKKNYELAVKMILSLNNIIKINTFEWVTCYSSEYSFNKISLAFLKLKGVKPINLLASNWHRNETYKYLSVSKNFDKLPGYDIGKNWENFKVLPNSSDEYSVVKNFVNSNIYSKSFFTYSSSFKNIDIYKKYQIDKKKKIIFVICSSNDEIFAFTTQSIFKKKKYLFNKEEDWINNLIKYSKGLKDEILIIRPHPRIFKRNITEQVNFFNKLKKKKYKNIIVNLPEDNLSIYDILRNTDLVLASCSSFIIDVAFFNIPILAHNLHLNLGYEKCIRDIVFQATNRKEYFKMIKILPYKQKTNLQQKSLNAFKIISLLMKYNAFKTNNIYDLDISNLSRKFMNKFSYYLNCPNILLNYYNFKFTEDKNLYKAFNKILTTKIRSSVEFSVLNKSKKFNKVKKIDKKLDNKNLKYLINKIKIRNSINFIN